MASKAYVESLLNRLKSDVRLVITQAFTHVLDNLQIGGVAHQEKAVNFRWIRLDGTTSTTANAEFSIVHGAGQTPLYVLPFAPLDSTGSWITRLKVTRVADANRIYLSSPDTNAAFSVLVEI